VDVYKSQGTTVGSNWHSHSVRGGRRTGWRRVHLQGTELGRCGQNHCIVPHFIMKSWILSTHNAVQKGGRGAWKAQLHVPNWLYGAWLKKSAMYTSTYLVGKSRAKLSALHYSMGFHWLGWKLGTVVQPTQHLLTWLHNITFSKLQVIVVHQQTWLIFIMWLLTRQTGPRLTS